MNFTATMGKKKVIVELASFVGDQQIGYTGKISVTGKTKSEIISVFDYYIPPTTGSKTIEDVFFAKVSQLTQFKTPVRI